MTALEIAARLNGKPSGKGKWSARCPAHDDGHPSLSIAQGDDDRTLLRCQAGCSADAVVRACGLSLADLFAEPRASSNGKSRVVAEYEYRDENSKVLYVVERHEPKRFVQKVPDGNVGWRYKLDGVRRVPYRLPELLEAIARGQIIFIVEGEKDADALVALGLCATTSAQGAAWRWPATWSAYFEGARQVVVIPDCDKPGRKAAQQRAAIVATVCDDVRALDFAPERSDSYDVSAWLGEGHAQDELLTLAYAAPRIEAQAQNDAHEGGEGVGKLVTIRASEVHAQRITWFARYRIPFGAMTLLDGPGDIGKTTTLMGIIAAASVGRSFFDGAPFDPVATLIVVEEDSLGTLKMRLQAAGADLNRVHFITGVRLGDAIEPFTLPRHVAELERKLEESGARLVYVDSLFSHLELDSEGRMPQQVRRALRPVVEMIGRTGVAFAAVRHWTKQNGPASMRALGSVELGNVARSVLSFGRHPDDEGRYVIAATKHNLSRPASTVAYRIETLDATDDDEQTCEVTRVLLEGEVEGVTADDLAMRQPADPDERGVAEDWLQDYLHDGEPHASAAIYAAARKDGIGSRATLKRAARRLGVLMSREGFATKGGSQSVWTLPLGSRLAHSRSVSRADESAITDARKTLDSQRSAQGWPLGSNGDDEPSDGGVIRE